MLSPVILVKLCSHDVFPNSRWAASLSYPKITGLITRDSFFWYTSLYIIRTWNRLWKIMSLKRMTSIMNNIMHSFIKDFPVDYYPGICVRNNLSWNFEAKDEPFSYVVSQCFPSSGEVVSFVPGEEKEPIRLSRWKRCSGTLSLEIQPNCGRIPLKEPLEKDWRCAMNHVFIYYMHIKICIYIHITSANFDCNMGKTWGNPSALEIFYDSPFCNGPSRQGSKGSLFFIPYCVAMRSEKCS